MHYIYVYILLFISSGAFANECLQVAKHTKIKNTDTKKISLIFKGEQLQKFKGNRKFYKINFNDNNYLIYRNKVKKETVSCSEEINQCLVAKNDLNLRDSVLKKHKKVSVASGQELVILSVLKKRGKNYYRLDNGADNFLWISEKQKTRLFEQGCDGSSSGDSLDDLEPAEPSIDQLDDYMETPDEIDQQSLDDQREIETPEKMTSNFYFHLGYNPVMSAEFLTPFIDSISNPGNVKTDPNPIITEVVDGTAPQLEAHYRRNIFNSRIFWDVGLGYRFAQYAMKGKKNPATALSVVRLDSLEDTEIAVDLSTVTISGGAYYSFALTSSIKTLVGANLNINYVLNDKIEVVRRIGGNKLTEEPSILELTTIDFAVSPEVQFLFNYGLGAYIRYAYSIEYGGHPSVSLGYSF